MKVFMIGGSGLLGAEAARQLIADGHQVTTICLAPLPEEANIPKQMSVEFGDVNKLSDNKIKKLMHNAQVFVFAAGVDERIEFRTPKHPKKDEPKTVYEFYHKFNIAPLERLIKLAKSCGISRTIVLGSYFTHFDTIWPNLNLYYQHPYIRSRVDQKNMALSYADKNHIVAVLELPYVFGVQRGRKPVWMFLKDLVDASHKTIYYPKGGTTMVTVRQVGQAVKGAATKNIESKAFPVGWYNMTGKELLTLVTKFDGHPEKKVVTIPNFLYKIFAFKIRRRQKQRGIQSGLDPVKFVKLMTRNCYIYKNIIDFELDVKPDDIEAAIKESITYCKEIKENAIKTTKTSDKIL